MAGEKVIKILDLAPRQPADEDQVLFVTPDGKHYRAAAPAFARKFTQQLETDLESNLITARAINDSFIQRSLSLAATIYVNGTNGNDTRTGTTNTTDATTGAVKTLARVAALHNNKTYCLTIEVKGVLELTEDITLIVPTLLIKVNGSGSVLRMQKKNIYSGATLLGEGNHRLIMQSNLINIAVSSGGLLESVAHGGKVATGAQWDYNIGQGALSIKPFSVGESTAEIPTLTIRQLDGTIIVGDNTVLVNPGHHGLNYITVPNAIYLRNSYSGIFTLGANAIESRCTGGRDFMRSYHPTSSTDANVAELEQVISPTNNKVWIKRNGTIRDVMGTTFTS